jgi:hypothetical protein
MPDRRRHVLLADPWPQVDQGIIGRLIAIDHVRDDGEVEVGRAHGLSDPPVVLAPIDFRAGLPRRKRRTVHSKRLTQVDRQPELFWACERDEGMAAADGLGARHVGRDRQAVVVNHSPSLAARRSHWVGVAHHRGCPRRSQRSRQCIGAGSALRCASRLRGCTTSSTRPSTDAS